MLSRSVVFRFRWAAPTLLGWALSGIACVAPYTGPESIAASTETAGELIIEIPATEAPLSNPFSIDSIGVGLTRFQSVVLHDGVGEIILNGEHIPLAVYQYAPWPEFDLEWFQALAVAEDRLYVVWLYCQGASLVGYWIEGTDQTRLVWEDALGTCRRSNTATTTIVRFPALTMTPPALEPHWTISGPNVDYDGLSPGFIALPDADFSVYPFQGVDCSDCGAPGWYELHALLWDESRRRLCFAIFYFHDEEPNQVALQYSLTLPDLSDPSGYSVFSATWTRPYL